MTPHLTRDFTLACLDGFDRHTASRVDEFHHTSHIHKASANEGGHPQGLQIGISLS